MNERIRELAKEATDWCCENAIGTPVAWEWEEKFAELIVKDCCSIVMGDRVLSWADSIRLSNIIKEEYGVDE